VKTNLTARNLELSDLLREQIEHKLQRLDRITHDLAEADVELIAKASHAADSAQVAEVTLRNNGDVLRSTATGATPMAALDIGFRKVMRDAVEPLKLVLDLFSEHVAQFQVAGCQVRLHSSLPSAALERCLECRARLAPAGEGLPQ